MTHTNNSQIMDSAYTIKNEQRGGKNKHQYCAITLFVARVWHHNFLTPAESSGIAAAVAAAAVCSRYPLLSQGLRTKEHRHPLQRAATFTRTSRRGHVNEFLKEKKNIIFDKIRVYLKNLASIP